MKLLFDQNLSPKLVKLLADLFPGSSHVYLIALDQAEDEALWNYAKDNNFTLVSKDTDFSDLATLWGFPPRVIWIRRGNCKTSDVESMLRERFGDIKALHRDEIAGILALF